MNSERKRGGWSKKDREWECGELDGGRRLRWQKSLLRKGHAQAKRVVLNTVDNGEPRPTYAGSHVPIFGHRFWKLSVIIEDRMEQGSEGCVWWNLGGYFQSPVKK